MKFKDTMTARERIEAFYEGKPYDRIPTGIFMSDHSAGLVGARVVDMHLSAEINTKAQIAAYKAYGTEEVGAIVGVGGVAEILGMKLNFPENSNPYPVSHPILSQEDLENTSLPPFFSAGRFPMFYEISERLLEAVGNEVPVVVGMPGPFTTAGGLRGTENFMRDLYQNPEFAHEVLRLSLEATLLFIRETAKLGVGFSIGEPTASGTLIGAKQFHEFAFPYLKACLDEISRLGCRLTSLHICGNTRKIWNAMVDAGAEILSLDERIDLLEAKREVAPGRCCWEIFRPRRSCCWARRRMWKTRWPTACARFGTAPGAISWDSAAVFLPTLRRKTSWPFMMQPVNTEAIRSGLAAGAACNRKNYTIFLHSR